MEQLQTYINKHIEQFQTEVLDEIINNGYQYIRPLLSKSKEAERRELKNQIIAYEKVIAYLLNESKKEIDTESIFLSNKSNNDLVPILIDAKSYLSEHIQERVERYRSIIDVSRLFLQYFEQKTNESLLIELFEKDLDKVTNLNDTSQRRRFLASIFRMILRLLGSEDKKVSYILSLLSDDIQFNKKIKTLYNNQNKPTRTPLLKISIPL